MTMYLYDVALLLLLSLPSSPLNPTQPCALSVGPCTSAILKLEIVSLFPAYDCITLATLLYSLSLSVSLLSPTSRFRVVDHFGYKNNPTSPCNTWRQSGVVAVYQPDVGIPQ